MIGAVWLSLVCVVRCWVKSRNERNPCPQLLVVWLGILGRLPVINRRKVGMTLSHYGPYGLGYICVIMAGIEGSDPVRVSESHKTGRSLDRSL